MLKKLFPFALLLIAVALSCCSNGEDAPPVAPPPVIPPAKSAKLTNAYSVANPTDSKRVQLIISNFDADFIEEFTGVGEFLSLELEAPGITVTEGVLTLPSGEYTFETGTQKICKSEVCYYSSQDDSGKKTLLPLTGGTFTVSKSADAYTLTGEVSDANLQVIKFSFTGALPLDPGTGMKTMTDVTVTYNNKFTLVKKFAYSLLLRNEDGQQVSLDISTALSDYFTNIPVGTYQFSDAGTDAGTLLMSDNSYYTLTADGTQRPIGAGSVTLTKTASGYTLTGNVSAPGKRGVEFTFTGALPVTKAALYFKDGDLTPAGQNSVFYCYENHLASQSSNLKTVGEKAQILFGCGIDPYYQYIPMKTGAYPVNPDKKQLPSTIITSSSLSSKLGIQFANSDGVATLYYYKGGKVELTTSSMTGTKYSFAFNGLLDVETKTGEKLTVDLTWDGMLDKDVEGAGYGHWYLAHPWSTLESDYTKNDFARGVFWDYGTGYWAEEGGAAKDTGYLQLYLVGQNAIFWEWFNPDIWGYNHYFMTIGLNIKGEMASDGSIPTGIYTYDKDCTFAPGTFTPGNNMSGSNIVLGSSIFNGPQTVNIPLGCGPDNNGGEVKITRSGDIYTVTVKAFDDIWPNPHKINVTFTGQFTNVEDEIEPEWTSGNTAILEKPRRRNFVEQ